jgi:hypothetical protein
MELYVYTKSAPLCIIYESRDSAVDVTTGYGLDDRGFEVRVLVGSRIFPSSCRPDWIWGTPSLLFSGYWRPLSPGVKQPERVKLLTHIHQVPRSRKREFIHPFHRYI